METLGFLALCRLDVGRSCGEFFYWARAAGTFWSRFWYCHPLRRSPHWKGKKGVASIAVNLSEPSNQAMQRTAEHPMHVYEVRPRKDKRGVDLISDALPFGRLWYDTPDHAIGYAMHSSRSHRAVIRVLRCRWQHASDTIRSNPGPQAFQE